ncbi:MAG: SagB/ThcOx family dehydrogenase [Bacteroidales bacterium]|jgi:SagB-type dehydrogenase family enzyme
MKKIIIQFCFAVIATSLFAQGTKVIVLNPPDTTKGLPVMKALSLRASATKWDTAALKLQDLSDLLWAANGINRHATGKRTAPSAMNAQDIDVYVFLKSGAYLYDAVKNALNLVAEGDKRNLCIGKQSFTDIPPVFCLLVSDISKFKSGNDSTKLVLAAEDAGLVSENIAVFCASVGLATRPRATMDQENLKKLLNLKPSQRMMLNNPVSYKKD